MVEAAAVLRHQFSENVSFFHLQDQKDRKGYPVEPTIIPGFLNERQGFLVTDNMVGQSFLKNRQNDLK